MDQDILNFYFASNYKRLDVKYDICVYSIRRTAYEKQIDNIIRFGILHYAGDELLIFPAYDACHVLWLSFFFETPWHDFKYMSKILIEINKKIDENREITMRLINSIRNKNVKIYYYNSVIDYKILIEKFNFMDNIEIIEMPLSNNDKKEVSWQFSTTNREISILFFPIETYESAKIQLTNLGFIEGDDFVNGFLMIQHDAYNYGLMRIPYAI